VKLFKENFQTSTSLFLSNNVGLHSQLFLEFAFAFSANSFFAVSLLLFFHLTNADKTPTVCQSFCSMHGYLSEQVMDACGEEGTFIPARRISKYLNNLPVMEGQCSMYTL
jgi:hypothetical protein